MNDFTPFHEPGSRAEHDQPDAAAEPLVPPEAPGPATSATDPPRPIQQVEDDICTLAGHLAAATCRWLLLLAEFDRRGGWHGGGLRSCAQWLSWRCGISPGAAREQLRVARALESLPAVRAAFGAGRLSYAKTRAITRIATADNERDLVELAESSTAAQLERFVGGHRRAKRADEDADDRPFRSVTWRWDDDGHLLLRARLAPEEGALLLAAMGAVASAAAKSEPASPDGSPDPHDATDPCDPRVAEPVATNLETDRADALVAVAATALEHGPIDHTGADRFQVVVHADLEQVVTALGNPAAGAPADDPVAPREGTDAADAADAAQTDPTEPSLRSTAGIRRWLRRGRCHLAGGPCLHPATLDRLLCEASVRIMLHDRDGIPLDAGRRQRLVTPGLRRLVLDRDGHMCQFAGCGATQYLHIHHLKAWALGGRTDLANLVTLCGFHHRLLHERGYDLRAAAPGRFDAYRPDGSRIDPAPATSGDGRLDQLHEPRRGTPPITPSTPGPVGGGRLDLPYAVSVLLTNEEIRRQRSSSAAVA